MTSKALGIALVAVGVLLLVWGISAADSLASEVSEFFTGEPTNRSMWLIIGGVAAIVGGGVLAVISGKRALKS